MSEIRMLQPAPPEPLVQVDLTQAEAAALQWLFSGGVAIDTLTKLGLGDLHRKLAVERLPARDEIERGRKFRSTAYL